MENSDTINISLAISRRTALFILAALFLTWRPGYLGSETLTLTTYYPAPYGGYAGLLTTGGTAGAPVNTLLVRDAGNVGIGTANPTGKLDIAGGGIEMDDGALIHSRGSLNTSGTGTFTMSYGGGARVATGNLVVQNDLQVQNNLRVAGFIQGQCFNIPYATASGVSFCGGGRTVFQTYGNGVPQVFGYFTDGAGTPIGRLGFGQDWNGTMLCCRIN